MKLVWAGALFLASTGCAQALAPETVKLLNRVTVKVPVAPENLSGKELAGTWDSGGGGLAGAHLYLFPDSTYAYTEWSDVFPEMVVDRGGWKPGPGIVYLSPDAEFARDRQNDSAFLILRPEADPGKLLLLGVDHHLPRFEQEPGDPLGWLEVCSLERKGPWADGEASRVKMRLATPRLFRIPEPIKLH